MALVYKSLADGQLAAAKATLYTVPGATTAAIKQITYTNTDASSRTVNLYLKRSGSTSRRIIPKTMTLASGSTMYWGDGDTMELSTGDIIEGDASAATVVDYVVTGAER
jgi:hypothetical protein